jgi:two-component system response regulator NreC
MKPRIRILLCDDHPLFREGIKAILAAEREFDVVGEATNGKQAVEKAGRLDPDIVILDIAMPVLGGSDAARAMKRGDRGIKILIFTMYDDEELVARCLDAGASGYLLKDAPPEELIHAIKQVHAGGTYLSSGPLSRVVSQYVSGTPRPDAPHDRLTEREREVLILLAEGHSVKEIATRLDVSTKTVDAHKYNLMSKLDLHNKAQIVKYAIAHKLIRL